MDSLYNERCEKLLGFLADKDYRPMDSKNISLILGIRSEDMPMFYDMLTELENKGKIIVTKREMCIRDRYVSLPRAE